MTIKPELGAGFRDYLPADMIPRQKMLTTIQSVFERFGFLPLDTPSIERMEILTGGDPNFRMNIFRINTSEDKEPLAIRFDLTVPLARVVAAYPQAIEKPFKRYQVGKVCRGETPGSGRFREFVQFDADIVGAPGMMADAEIVSLMFETMKGLGFSKFLIRVNNRKILNGLAEYAGFPAQKTPGVLRSIDKLDKFGWEKVYKELTAKQVNEFDESALDLTEAQAEAIRRFIELRGAGHEEVLDAVQALMSNSVAACEGIQELRDIVRHARALGVLDDKWTIDLSVARGLGYYTGPVFETILTNLPGIGSVFSGGRYDDLVARFGNTTIPATGASVGVDRLFAAMEQLKLIPHQPSVSQVLVLNFDPSCQLWCEEIANDLRRAGIATEIYLGQERSLKGQLVYAVKQEIPVVVIAGSNERERGSVQLKDMRKRTQQEVIRSQLPGTIKGVLALS